MYELTARRRAILATINWAEGLPGYNQLFNYVPFNNYGPHPNIEVTASGYTSTAAGAYQFLYATWQDSISNAGISDYMAPDNQDQAAIERIDYRGVLDAVDSGDITGAMEKLSWEWASLPYLDTNGNSVGRYGQPIKTMDEVVNYFNQSYAYYAPFANTAAVPVSSVAYNDAVKKNLPLKQPLQLRRLLYLPLRFMRFINKPKAYNG